MSMSSLMGSFCFSLTPLHHSLFPPPPHSSPSVFLKSLSKNGGFSRKSRTVTACVHPENSKDGGFCKRRAILFVGISVLPLLQLKGKDLHVLAIEPPVIRTEEQKQEAEKALQGDAAPNFILSLLNGLGICSAGVLGALYALARKKNITSEEMIESMKNKLNEREEAIVSLEKAFKSKLLNEKEERNRLLNRANEEQQTLMNQLNLAKGAITKQEQALQSQQRLVEDLKTQAQNHQTQITKAGEAKKELEDKLNEKLKSVEALEEKITLLSSEIKDKEDNLHDLNSMLTEKDSELKKLNSTYERTCNEIAGVNSKNASLREVVLKNQKELGVKNAKVDDLNAQIRKLVHQRDDLNNQLDSIRKEYDDLKSSSEEKAAADANLLGERDCKILQLKEKIDLTLNEMSKNQVFVADLSQERDDLRKMLDLEINNVKNLKHELQITQELLGKSRNEVSNLEKQLQKSRNLCLDQEREISKIQTEFAKARESFKSSLDEAKKSTEVLANELTSTNEVLENTKSELQIISRELTATIEYRDDLQKELVDAYKKAESTNHDLKEEKKVVSSLNKELQALEKQILKDKESRKSLEADLEAATKSLNEMNQNALLLSRELEIANSQISTLEEDKELIYKNLDEQKRVTQEARDNLEDAHNLLMRLGKERENLEKKGKKLEEELAAAKGEILRLRSEINSSRGIVNNQSREKVEREGNAAAVSVKKNSRRRKGSSQQDNSS